MLYGPDADTPQSYKRAVVISSGSQVTFESIDFVHAGLEIKGSTTSLTLKNVLFSKMQGLSAVGGDNYGSAINAHTGSTVHLQVVSILKSSSQYGGAVSLRGSSTLHLCGLTAQSNTASDSGGAMFVESSTVHLESGDTCAQMTYIGNNRATAYGGGMYITGDSTLNGNSLLNITKNTAGTGGGGIAAMGHSHSVTVKGNAMQLVGNEASKPNGQGGATFQPGGGILVTGENGVSSFRHLILSGNVGSRGGGMMVDQGATVDFNSVTVELGMAHASGGGVHVHNSSLFLMDTTLQHNKVTPLTLTSLTLTLKSLTLTSLTLTLTSLTLTLTLTSLTLTSLTLPRPLRMAVVSPPSMVVCLFKTVRWPPTQHRGMGVRYMYRRPI